MTPDPVAPDTGGERVVLEIQDDEGLEGVD